MTLSVEALAVVVVIATGVATVAPIVLLTLFIRDWKRGRLW